jgi:hypothetical protein
MQGDHLVDSHARPNPPLPRYHPLEEQWNHGHRKEPEPVPEPNQAYAGPVQY